MITGNVTEEREPLVEITVLGPDGNSLVVEALVDTGSDGHLTLTPDQVDRLGLPWLQSGQAVLADGTESMFDIYGGVVLWDGAQRRVVVDAIDAPPLIGMALLDRHEVNIQVIAGGTVSIRSMDVGS